MDGSVHKEVELAVAPDRAFALFTRDIGGWWPLATHGLLGADAAVAFEGERLVERLGERAAVWAEVLTWDPPHLLRLAWHPGAPADAATDLVVAFERHAGGTRLVLDHTGWERAGRAASAAGYDEGWELVLGRLTARAAAGVGS